MDKTTVYMGVVLLIATAMLCCTIAYLAELEFKAKNMEIQSNHILGVMQKNGKLLNAQQ